MKKFHIFWFFILFSNFCAIFVSCQDNEVGVVEQVKEKNATVNYIRFQNNGFFGTFDQPQHRNHQIAMSHDRQTLLNQCGGIYKNLQNLIDSPKFISPRPICNLRCEYQIVSPYICENEFHVQFLNFSLDSSEDCKNERVIINYDEVFCGRQIESRKFKTQGGILNITFSSKSFDAQEGRGFKLLVTRLPCIDDKKHQEEILETSTKDDENCFKEVNSTITVGDVSKEEENPPIYGSFNRTISARQDIPVQPLPPPSPVYPPFPPGPPVGPIPGPIPVPFPACCQNIYNQNRFVMLSQGFPAHFVSDNDCLYTIQRSSPNACRLKIIFKFFNLDDPTSGEFGELGCFNNFIEIDGQRLCGCKTNFVFETTWGYEPIKNIRLHTRPGRFPNAQGFIFDVIQEMCPFKLRDANENPNRFKRFINFHNLQKPELMTTFPHFFQRKVDFDDKFMSKFFQPSDGFVNNVCTWNHLKLLQIKFETLAIPKQYCIRY